MPTGLDGGFISPASQTKQLDYIKIGGKRQERLRGRERIPSAETLVERGDVGITNSLREIVISFSV